MANYYCMHCGHKSSSVSTLTSTSCTRRKGKHQLYEGSEKSKYTCKYCGQSYSSISTLTGMSCTRHPDGNGKGKHSPAL